MLLFYDSILDRLHTANVLLPFGGYAMTEWRWHHGKVHIISEVGPAMDRCSLLTHVMIIVLGLVRPAFEHTKSLSEDKGMHTHVFYTLISFSLTVDILCVADESGPVGLIFAMLNQMIVLITHAWFIA
jgi:hypothetical protein